MSVQTRPRLLVILASLVMAIAIALPLTASAGAQTSASHAAATQTHMTLNCEYSSQCTEVGDNASVFGDDYVGHDEPSTLFYSNRPGSGNQMTYAFKLPTDPKPAKGGVPKAGQSFEFELGSTFWFGMAVCATESYPLQKSTCTPDSDSNIYDGQDAAHPLSQHPGTAFVEMQFYPPGWVTWPNVAGSCSATQWCAALNIDSLAEDPVAGTAQNATCVDNVIGSPEYVNFAFITKNGRSQAPANPVDSTQATFTPDHTQDLFMNPGDNVITSMHDTPNGLRIDIIDLTTHQVGSMTASAANGFGQVQYDPTGTSCTNIPYDFHPMYSTSSEHTRVIWAAHSYNIAFDDEIGHFEACNGPNQITPGGACPAGNTEYDGEPSDSNDQGCFPASFSSLIQVNGCTEGSGVTGFDSMPYQTLWPDGNKHLHPTSIQFTSPITEGHQYERVAFEANLPRVEAPGLGSGNNCVRTTGVGCTLIPLTDDGQPANFYPFYSIDQHHGSCVWLFGNDIPGQTTNDFGRNNQYGSELFLDYLVFGGGGAAFSQTDNFRQVLNSNPCPAF